MAWPVGVTLRSVTVSPAVVFETGTALPVASIKVSASHDLVWASTGVPLRAMLSSVTSPFNLPVTDQSGWLLNGEPVSVADGAQTHTYTLRIAYTGAAKQFYTVGPFALPEGDGTPVDADMLAPLCSSDGGGTVLIPLLETIEQLQATVLDLQDQINDLAALGMGYYGGSQT